MLFTITHSYTTLMLFVLLENEEYENIYSSELANMKMY